MYYIILTPEKPDFTRLIIGPDGVIYDAKRITSVQGPGGVE